MSGPSTEGLQFRRAGNWEKQRKGYYDNIVPGMPSEGDVKDQYYVEGQLKAHMFDERPEAWVKVAISGWDNGAGGPGDKAGYSTAPFNFGDFGKSYVRAGFACAPPGAARPEGAHVANTLPPGR